MFEDKLNDLCNSLRNDLGIEKAKDILGDLLFSRYKIAEKAIIKHPKYKAVLNERNKMCNELSKYLDKEHMLSFDDDYAASFYDLMNIYMEVMYKYGFYDALSIILELPKPVKVNSKMNEFYTL